MNDPSQDSVSHVETMKPDTLDPQTYQSLVTNLHDAQVSQNSCGKFAFVSTQDTALSLTPTPNTRSIFFLSVYVWFPRALLQSITPATPCSGSIATIFIQDEVCDTSLQRRRLMPPDLDFSYLTDWDARAASDPTKCTEQKNYMRCAILITFELPDITSQIHRFTLKLWARYGVYITDFIGTYIPVPHAHFSLLPERIHSLNYAIPLRRNPVVKQPKFEALPDHPHVLHASDFPWSSSRFVEIPRETLQEITTGARTTLQLITSLTQLLMDDLAEESQRSIIIVSARCQELEQEQQQRLEDLQKTYSDALVSQIHVLHHTANLETLLSSILERGVMPSCASKPVDPFFLKGIQIVQNGSVVICGLVLAVVCSGMLFLGVLHSWVAESFKRYRQVQDATAMIPIGEFVAHNSPSPLLSPSHTTRSPRMLTDHHPIRERVETTNMYIHSNFLASVAIDKRAGKAPDTRIITGQQLYCIFPDEDSCSSASDDIPVI